MVNLPSDIQNILDEYNELRFQKTSDELYNEVLIPTSKFELSRLAVLDKNKSFFKDSNSISSKIKRIQSTMDSTIKNHNLNKKIEKKSEELDFVKKLNNNKIYLSEINRLENISFLNDENYTQKIEKLILDVINYINRKTNFVSSEIGATTEQKNKNFIYMYNSTLHFNTAYNIHIHLVLAKINNVNLFTKRNIIPRIKKELLETYKKEKIFLEEKKAELQSRYNNQREKRKELEINSLNKQYKKEQEQERINREKRRFREIDDAKARKAREKRQEENRKKRMEEERLRRIAKEKNRKEREEKERRRAEQQKIRLAEEERYKRIAEEKARQAREAEQKIQLEKDRKIQEQQERENRAHELAQLKIKEEARIKEQEKREEKESWERIQIEKVKLEQQKLAFKMEEARRKEAEQKRDAEVQKMLLKNRHEEKLAEEKRKQAQYQYLIEKARFDGINSKVEDMENIVNFQKKQTKK